MLEKRAATSTLRDEGYSLAEIENSLNIPKKSEFNVSKRKKEIELLTNLKRFGGIRITSSSEYGYMPHAKETKDRYTKKKIELQRG